VTTLQEVIDLAENGKPGAGRAVWQQLASLREQGLDLSAMPAELVAWFDRRLEALTDIPAATRMGSRVTADEAARLLTPQERTEKDDLAALCLLPPKGPPKARVGRPASKRKRVADRILAAQVFERVAARKRHLRKVRRSGQAVPLNPICSAVADLNDVSVKRVERAVREVRQRETKTQCRPADRSSVPATTMGPVSMAEAKGLAQSLEKRGIRRLPTRGVPLRPGTYRAFRTGDRVRIEYLEP
jgi:hypothetical protein